MTNIYSAHKGFKILETTRRSQTATMTLDPGESSSEKPNAHPESDQVLIVLEGKITAEISGKHSEMKKGRHSHCPGRDAA
jgi:mannose-6-phosphate isomerase-like protein (cupin superfamily)